MKNPFVGERFYNSGEWRILCIWPVLPSMVVKAVFTWILTILFDSWECAVGASSFSVLLRKRPCGSSGEAWVVAAREIIQNLIQNLTRIIKMMRCLRNIYWLPDFCKDKQACRLPKLWQLWIATSLFKGINAFYSEKK